MTQEERNIARAKAEEILRLLGIALENETKESEKEIIRESIKITEQIIEDLA